MIRKLAMAMVVSGALGSSYANALGLGEIKLNSALNQPLDAEVKLLNVGDLSKNEILPNLASHDDFSRAGVERVFFLTGIKFDVELDGEGGAVIHLTTDRIVREPFLNFLIELHWPSGRLLREYTALLDPPLFSQAPLAPVQQAVVQKTPVTPAPEKNQETRVSAPAAVSTVQTPSQSKQKGGTVRVKKNDTLWGIAEENRPDQSVTVRQTMVAIQQENPQAFIKSNINLLKSGAVLRIPEVEEIRRISSRDAYAETVRQTQEWQGKKTIDARQDSQLSSQQESTASEPAGLVKLVAPETSDETAESAQSAGGALTSGEEGVSTGGASESGSGSGSVSGASNVAEVAEIQKQLDDLQRLMTLKQEQLALLQANQEELAQAEAQAQEQAEQALSEAVEGELATGSETVDAVVTGEDPAQTSEQTSESAEATVSDAELSTEVVSEPVADDVTAVSTTDTQETQIQPSQQEQPKEGFLDMLMNNAIYVGGALIAVLLGLLAFGAASRRKKAEQEYPEDLQQAIDTSEADIEIPDNLGDDLVELDAEPATETAKPVSNLAAAQPILGDDAPAEDDVRKVLDEADIFIAYGRYERAVEILQPAVNSSPDNSELHLKLAEVHLLNKDDAGFSQQEADINALGDTEALSALEALKQKYTADVDDTAEIAAEEAGFSTAEDAAEVLNVAGEESAATDESTEFDFADNFESEGSSEETAEESFELDDIEFELPEEDVNESLDSSVEEMSEEQGSVDSSADSSVEFDMDDDFLDIDSETEDSSSDELTVGEADASPDTADDMDFLLDTDESATKLELAKAYIDMADTEAAQEILNEVLTEGSEAQQQEAKKLLENLE